MIGFLTGVWGKLAAGAVVVLAVLAAILRVLAGAKKAGRDEEIVKQQQARVEAKNIADQVDNDVGAMTEAHKREELRKWKKK